MTSEERAPAQAVLAGHGDFAAGMIRAVLQITGRSDMFLPISNAAMSREELEQSIRAHVAAGASVIFTDLPAGSCTVAARKVIKGKPGVALVTGVNLAALLDFALNAARPAADAAQAAAEKARAAIGVVEGG
jgi:PTS system N-acetylgalactosamine-specific IIA component